MSPPQIPLNVPAMKKHLHKINFLKTSLLLTALFLATGCAIKMLPNKWDLPPKSENEVSVMHFNVENLFDTEDDPDRDDFTFLPLAMKQTPEHRALCAKQSTPFRQEECLTLDYNETLLKKKMSNIAEIILEVDGTGPDVLVLIEVENENVLKRLNSEHLQKANYQTVVLIEGPDERGIDIGLLSRYPLAGKAQLHLPQIKESDPEQAKWANRTRGILDVPLKMPNGETLHVLGAHFPSQANPTPWRKQMLEQIVSVIQAKGEKAMVVAGGDLNITAEEESSHKLFKKIAEPTAAISHFLGCKKCPGTHNYRKRWSFLDVQLYSKALQANGSGKYMVLPETIDVVRYNDKHISRGKYPLRWNSKTYEGVADHWPVYTRLRPRASETPAPSQTK